MVLDVALPTFELVSRARNWVVTFLEVVEETNAQPPYSSVLTVPTFFQEAVPTLRSMTTVRPALAGAVDPLSETGVLRAAFVMPEIDTAVENETVLLEVLTELRELDALTRIVFLPAELAPQLNEYRPAESVCEVAKVFHLLPDLY